MKGLCPTKGAAPIGATPEWSQVLLIFPSSTCSFNSIPYFPDQVRRCIVWIVASNGGFRNKMMIGCITVFVDTMTTVSPCVGKSGIS